MYKIINGSITSPSGFKASGVACGIKKDEKLDLALVVSDKPAAVAGVFTKNLVKGHSLQLTMEHIKQGLAKAILINSGNANACVGPQGYQDALDIVQELASILSCPVEQILFGSTGVIGVPLDTEKIKIGVNKVIQGLSISGSAEAAEAILTTDLVTKEACVELELKGKNVTIGGVAKGSGMIHPNMATMISIITTDANISVDLLKKALASCVDKSFNRISVDGDTSVCDKVIIMANGMSNTGLIQENSDEYLLFCDALNEVSTILAKKIAADGEGATKLIEVLVKNAGSQKDAYLSAVSVAKSPLVKTAIYGEDANWGRIITAVGYSGASLDPNSVDIYIGDLLTCKDGVALDFDEERAANILRNSEITLTVDLKKGSFHDRLWTCDFTHGYIEINGSYRT